MAASISENTHPVSDKAVFSYKTLRFFLGLVLISLPVAVLIISFQILGSISASWYTPHARDAFVGELFAVAVLLGAYNGHPRDKRIGFGKFEKALEALGLTEKRISKIGAVAAIAVAVFPTSDPNCKPPAGFNSCSWDWNVYIHYGAAIILFSVAAYFCLVAFRREKPGGDTAKRVLRKKIYFVCGWLIILCLLIAAIFQLKVLEQAKDNWRVILVVEWVALWAFGLAWFVAGHTITWLVDEKDLNVPKW